MRRPGASSLVALALALSAASGAAGLLLPLLGLKLSTAVVLIAGLGCYNLAMVSLTDPRPGRAAGWMLTLALTLLAMLANHLPNVALLAMLGWTWLLRCALLHRSIVSCLGDATLLASGVGAALWAYQSGAGLGLSLWCFYLLQTLLPWLPHSSRAVQLRTSDAREFSVARRRAESALRRLYVRPRL